MTTLALTPLLAMDDGPAGRLNETATVFSEIMGAPDQGISQDPAQLLELLNLYSAKERKNYSEES